MNDMDAAKLSRIALAWCDRGRLYLEHQQPDRAYVLFGCIADLIRGAPPTYVYAGSDLESFLSDESDVSIVAPTKAAETDRVV